MARAFEAEGVKGKEIVLRSKQAERETAQDAAASSWLAAYRAKKVGPDFVERLVTALGDSADDPAVRQAAEAVRGLN